MNQESYRKSRDSGGEPKVLDKNMRESTMILTFHNCKKPGCKMKDCKQLMKKSDKSSDVENVKIKWCSYHRCNGHSNKYCYQQYWESANRDRKKIWCTYYHRASHLNDECFHQRGNKFENSSFVDTENYRKRKPSLLIVSLLAAMQGFAVNVKGKTFSMKVTTSRVPHHLALGSHLRCAIPPYLKKLTASNFWWIQGRPGISSIQS